MESSFEVEHELAGWTLAWASLAMRPEAAVVAAEARATAARRRLASASLPKA